VRVRDIPNGGLSIDGTGEFIIGNEPADEPILRDCGPPHARAAKPEFAKIKRIVRFCSDGNACCPKDLLAVWPSRVHAAMIGRRVEAYWPRTRRVSCRGLAAP
jgi:hypothetical protein